MTVLPGGTAWILGGGGGSGARVHLYQDSQSCLRGLPGSCTPWGGPKGCPGRRQAGLQVPACSATIRTCPGSGFCYRQSRGSEVRGSCSAAAPGAAPSGECAPCPGTPQFTESH